MNLMYSKTCIKVIGLWVSLPWLFSCKFCLSNSEVLLWIVTKRYIFFKIYLIFKGISIKPLVLVLWYWIYRSCSLLLHKGIHTCKIQRWITRCRLSRSQRSYLMKNDVYYLNLMNINLTNFNFFNFLNLRKLFILLIYFEYINKNWVYSLI